MGIRRRDSGSFNYCSYFSSIVFTNIKDIPAIPKNKLIQNPAKYFLFGSELTLWDSLYKDIIGIKGLLFLYPSEVDGAKEWRRRPTRHIQIHSLIGTLRKKLIVKKLYSRGFCIC